MALTPARSIGPGVLGLFQRRARPNASFEPWGVTLRIVQVPLLMALLYLAVRPTEQRRAEIREYLGRIDIHWAMGRAAAAFDTRLDWPRLLSGSAADQIANRLAALGAKVMGTPGSFLVTMAPELEPGELERAEEWAERLAEAMKPVRV